MGINLKKDVINLSFLISIKNVQKKTLFSTDLCMLQTSKFKNPFL